MGINHLDQVVGTCTVLNPDNSRTYTAFVYSNGAINMINYPGISGNTWANGVNDAGQIVGYYEDPSKIKWHGFIYNFGGDGSFSSFDYPGITQAASYATVLTGINGQGRNCLATPGRCR